jgi:hypothetical protein
MIFAPQKAKPKVADGQIMESFWRALFVRQSHGRQARQRIHIRPYRSTAIDVRSRLVTS